MIVLIPERTKREIEYLVEAIEKLWVRTKLTKFLGDNILSEGMTEELEYLLYCLDASLGSLKIEDLRGILR